MDGSLEKVGTSRRHDGNPDLREYLGPGGNLVQRDYDDNGDGVPDRGDYPQ